MSQWRVILTREAEKDLDKLHKQIRKRVIEKVLWLSNNFEEVIPLPLGGRWQGFFKLRIGDWRAIYEIDHSKREIMVHLIDKRDKIYKRR